MMYALCFDVSLQDFDFLGHDSAFKDRNVALQCVRVGFIPTTKTDIRDLGPMDEVGFHAISDNIFLGNVNESGNFFSLFFCYTS